MEVSNIHNTFIHTQVIYFVPKLVSTYIFYDNFKISSHIPNCTGNYNIWSKLVLIRRIPGKIDAALFACLESATQDTVASAHHDIDAFFKHRKTGKFGFFCIRPSSQE